MTRAAGHLASHSGYSSLIVPGVLLKRKRETLASPERKVLCGELRGKQSTRRWAGDAPPSGPVSPAAQRAPRPAARLARAAPLPVSSTSRERCGPAARPSESRHSSRARCGGKSPKGIPSQRKKAKLNLQAEAHRARRCPTGDTPPLPCTYQIIHVQKRLSYPEIRHPAA